MNKVAVVFTASEADYTECYCLLHDHAGNGAIAGADQV